MNAQAWHAIRTSRVQVNGRPVVLMSQSNRWGDNYFYEVRHDGRLFGQFHNDIAAALVRYAEVRDAAVLLADTIADDAEDAADEEYGLNCWRGMAAARRSQAVA